MSVEIPGALSHTSDGLTWTPSLGAVGYDVVSGDLATLRATAGDFAAATDTCEANDVAVASLDVADPAPGLGRWFLVRATFVSTNESWGFAGRRPRRQP